MGTPNFAVPILSALNESEEYEVQAVVTQPDRKVGRKKKVTSSPVKEYALKHKLNVLQPEKLTGSNEEQNILMQDIDLIVTAAYGQFLSKSLLNHPRYKAINVHASLLPKYRGAAPIHYALLNGEQVTGVTLMYMDQVMDTGDILSTKQYIIQENDNTGILFEKLSLLGRDLLMETLPALFNQEIKPSPQNEEEATYAPMIKAKQEKINWEKNAVDIFNKIRGLNPFPGAFTTLKGERFKIWEARVSGHTTQKKPGQVEKIGKKELLVACGQETVLSLEIVQPFGKGKMPIASYLGGNPISEGDQFG